jgi:transposase
MMTAEVKRPVAKTGPGRNELTELRLAAHYWEALHARARARAEAWKEKAQQYEKLIKQLEAKLLQRDQKITEQEARIAWLERQLFGRKSEKARPDPVSDDDSDQEGSKKGTEKRKRGQERGAKGHGRRRRPELPTEERVHDVPEEKRTCQKCGKPYGLFPRTEDSEEIHYEYRVVRVVHKRVIYHKRCTCDDVPGMVTAPSPPKLIPKGLFSIGFWVWVLMEKFLFQRPLYRIRAVLALQGLFVSQGTLTGGLKRLGEMVQPLYGRMLDRVRVAKHWHMDETRWWLFYEAEGKHSHRWWLWVAVTREVCVYLLDPTRSAQVPRSILGDDVEGIISADRFRSYKALVGEKILVAFCWVHVRRDYLKVQDGYPKLSSWAQSWVERIAELYELNQKRLQERSTPSRFRAKDRALRRFVSKMKAAWQSQLADETLHPAQRKVLASLEDHWDGLTLFVDHPDIPMDNNEAERRLRNPVVGRKNYYGSGSIWSGVLATACFTIFQTMIVNRIDPQKFLTAYFEACARNGGRAPENLDDFLPWNLSEEQKEAWHYPERPP